MSHWGRGTGYTYTTERLGFLNQNLSTERRAAMQAAMRPVGWMPLGSRRTMPPLDPLPVAIEQNDMYTSSQLRAAAHHNSLRRFGQLVPPQTADPTSSKMMLGEATTVSQLAFRRPPSSFSHSFGVVDRTNGKLRDGTTDFREQVYTMWNVRGAASPGPHNTRASLAPPC